MSCLMEKQLLTRRRDSARVRQIRPPQPPVYVFVIDVSQHAVQSGTSYLEVVA